MNTFWYISKILIPLSGIWFWIALLLLIALLTKNPKRKRKILISTLVFFMFLLNSGIIASFIRVWEVKPTPIQSINKPYKYGIVLGGFAAYDTEYKGIEFNK